MANLRSKRHDLLVLQFQKLLNSQRRPESTHSKHNNCFPNGDKPDIQVTVEGKRALIDMVFCSDPKRCEKEYEIKQQKYESHGLLVIPVVACGCRVFDASW